MSFQRGCFRAGSFFAASRPLSALLAACGALAVGATARADAVCPALDFVLVEGGGVSLEEDSIINVEYPFYISAYEITNEQYSLFLNAIAGQDDIHRLYTPLMEVHFWGGIVRRVDESGLATYTAKPGYENLPATYVSWGAAARFANWLHYGCPVAADGGGEATEGDSDHGAYDTRDGVIDAAGRNSGAKYWLPNRAEWLKAGFYDPATRAWRPYATGVAPSASLDGAQPSATFFSGVGWAAPFPHLTAVGAHGPAARSPAGTFDQAGNVMEWVEDHRGAARLALGGSVFMSESALRRSYVDLEFPDKQLSTFGFRVARSADPAVLTAAVSPPMSISRPGSAVGSGQGDGTELSGLRFRRIGLPGNPPDPITGRGAAPYVFLMGETEVTNAQWVRALDAAGAEAEALCLFHPAMADGVAGGLRRRADGAGFEPKPGWENRPVTYVTWYAAARFANFIHYGLTPSPGDDGRFDGDGESGAYDTRGFPEGCGASAANPEALPERRNDGALVFLPTADEWTKAAYYDPEKYGARKYWSYPDRSDTPPAAEPPPGGAHSANYQSDERLGEGPPYFVGEVDAYPDARSPFGALGMAGNVWEWLETWRSRGEGGCWRCDEWVRGLAGGSFNYTFIGLNIENVDPGAPHQAYPFYGLRLAAADSTSGFAHAAEGLSTRARAAMSGLSKRDAAALGFLAGGVVVAVGAGVLALVLRARRRKAPRKAA